MPIASTFLITGIILIILQTSVLEQLPLWLGRLDPCFLLVVYGAIYMDLLPGTVLIFILGMFMDICSGLFPWMYPVTFLIIFFLISWLAKFFIINEPTQRIILVAICSLLAQLINFVFISLMIPENPPAWNWQDIFLQMLILSVLSVPLFCLFDRVVSLLKKKKNGSILPVQQKNKPVQITLLFQHAAFS